MLSSSDYYYSCTLAKGERLTGDSSTGRLALCAVLAELERVVGFLDLEAQPQGGALHRHGQTRFVSRRPGGRGRLVSCAPTFAWLLLAVSVCGCHSIDSYVERCRDLAPRDYVVILPAGREELPCVERFLRYREAAGYATMLVPFSLDIEAGARWASVQEQLATRRSDGTAPAYALILADPTELPVEEWAVADLDGTVRSDLPRFLGLTPADAPLGEDAWRGAFVPEFPWIPGRIPFSDPALLARSLVACEQYESTRARPFALLGSERYAIWWDTSTVMGRARARFLDHDWEALSLATDSPNDVRLGDSDAGETLTELAATVPTVRHWDLDPRVLDDVEDGADLVFLTAWSQLRPDVVYLNSHGSSFLITTVGDYLLSERKLERIAALGDRGMRPAPAVPAVLVIAACRAGDAESTLTRALFAGGWVVALIASAEPTEPVPLVAGDTGRSADRHRPRQRAESGPGAARGARELPRRRRRLALLPHERFRASPHRPQPAGTHAVRRSVAPAAIEMARTTTDARVGSPRTTPDARVGSPRRGRALPGPYGVRPRIDLGRPCSR